MRFAAPFLFTATMLFGAAGSGAQDGFVFGADNLGAPVEAPGFGVAGKTAPGDWPELGASGLGDYSYALGRFSIVEPPQDVAGIWSVFRVTQLMCRALHQGNYSLVEAAPKGFVIARGDVHSIGFKVDHWDENWYAVTKTGDSETDAAGGHPAWEIRYNEDGSLSMCRVTLGAPTSRDQVAPTEAVRERVIAFMYVAAPQLLSAIVIDPQLAGDYPLPPSNALSKVSPCGDAWCGIETTFDFSPGSWYVSATIRFNSSP